jgi:integrase
MGTRLPTIIKLKKVCKKPHRVTFYEGAVRRTQHFANLIDAKAFAKEHGWEGLDRSLAVSAEERLLISKVRGMADVLHTTTAEIIEAGLNSLRGRLIEAPQLGEAIVIYRAAAEQNGSRGSSLDNLRVFLGFFERKMGASAVLSDISAVHVSTAARERYSNPESVRSYMAVVVAFFRWCAEAERQWADPAWFRRIKLRTMKTDKPKVTIAPPERVADFLYNVPAKYQAGFALQFFAGLRPEEMVPKDTDKKRLCWDAIDFQARTIWVSAEVSKTRTPRLIHNCFANLWGWLEAVPKAERTGPVLALNFRNFKRLRRAIANKANCPNPWPRDWPRHSFATYSFHLFGLETTINNTGHMNEPSTFFSHYKGSTVEAQAQAFSEIHWQQGKCGSGIWYAIKTEQDKARDCARKAQVTEAAD